MFKPFTKPMLLLSVIAQTLPLTIAAQTADPLPDGPGKPIVQRMCTGCHNIRVVTAKRATHDQWETIVQQMVSRGADGTDDEIAIVIDYLARNFPPSPKPTDPPPPAASVSTRVTAFGSEHLGSISKPSRSRSNDRNSDVDPRRCKAAAVFPLSR